MITIRVQLSREDEFLSHLREQKFVIVVTTNRAHRIHRPGEVWRMASGGLREAWSLDQDWCFNPNYRVPFEFHDDDADAAMLFKLMFGGQ